VESTASMTSLLHATTTILTRDSRMIHEQVSQLSLQVCGLPAAALRQRSAASWRSQGLERTSAWRPGTLARATVCALWKPYTPCENWIIIGQYT
jgi:hypothetical protein